MSQKERSAAFRRRHGRTLAVQIDPIAYDDLRYIKQRMHARSHRDVINRTLKALARALREGGALQLD